MATDNIPASSSRITDLERTCFVIMPFGKKQVGNKQVDFTAIYTEIFEPAIKTVKTPEGHPLIPARTDMDAFSSSINQDMFEYIMYSRLAFADISGFNPNVFYEIGARHSTQESGTVLFRQNGHAIPFDIASIKIFEYDDQPQELAETSRNFIARVLSETLKRNRLDSPVRLALRAQWGGSPPPPSAQSDIPAPQTLAASDATSPPGSASPSPPPATPPSAPPPEDDWRRQEAEKFMRGAEEAVRLNDLDLARMNYWGALRFNPLNVAARMRLGLVLKQQGKHYEALEEFTTITKLAPNYGEAWREKGVVEGLIARMIPKDKRDKALWLRDGYASLERASALIPGDFDVWSSWGGVLKNVRGDKQAAQKKYAHAAEISDNHPYPLLNALRLEAQRVGKLCLGHEVQEQLQKAAKLRLGQTLAQPPADVPWCYFDLAEICLYQSDKDGFLDYVDAGIRSCNADWQPETFLNSLRDTLLPLKDNHFDGLDEGIARLERAVESFRKK